VVFKSVEGTNEENVILQPIDSDTVQTSWRKWYSTTSFQFIDNWAEPSIHIRLIGDTLEEMDERMTNPISS